MRLSFEEFLREKTSDYAGDFSRSEVIDLFNEWSSQQPEDEVYEALEALAKRHKWNGHGVGGCVCKEHLKAEQILARKGNKDGEKPQSKEL